MSNTDRSSDAELAIAEEIHSRLSVGERLIVARRVLERALATPNSVLERKARSAILALLPGLGPTPLPAFLLDEAKHHVEKITQAFPDSVVARIECAGVLLLEGRFAEAVPVAADGINRAVADEDWNSAAAAIAILLDASRMSGGAEIDVTAPLGLVLSRTSDASIQVDLLCRFIRLGAATDTPVGHAVDQVLTTLERAQGSADRDALEYMADQVLNTVGRTTVDPVLVAVAADRIRNLNLSDQLAAIAEAMAIEALSRSEHVGMAHDRIVDLVSSLSVRPGGPPPAFNPRAYGPVLTSAGAALRIAESAAAEDPLASQSWLSLLFDCLAAFAFYGPPPGIAQEGLTELTAAVSDMQVRGERVAEELLVKAARNDAAMGPAGRPIAEELYRSQTARSQQLAGSLLDRPDSMARLSEANFASMCATFDWKVIPTPLEVDYGIDYRVEIPDAPGRASRDVEFLVQLKSSNQRQDERGRFRVSVKATTVDYWNSKLLPVLIVLYHQPTDAFYAVWHSAGAVAGKTKTYYFSSEDMLGRFSVAAAVRGFYESSRAALTSRGASSVFSQVLASSAPLLSILLANQHVRQALVHPAEVEAEFDHMFMTVVLVGMGRLEAPLPLLAEDSATADIVAKIRLIAAIRDSWWYTGGPSDGPWQIGLVARNRFWDSCSHLVTALADLSAFLAFQLAAPSSEGS